jgi:carboxymethylenebutenolidase
MCDDLTEAENDAHLEARLNRREVNLGAGAALAAILTGCTRPAAPAREPEPSAAPASEGSAQAPPPAAALAPEITSRMVTIETPEGTAEAFFVAPKGGKHPAVLLWPDVAGLRDAFQKMATRLAGEGYAVLAVNQYYRSAKLPILSTFSEWRTEAGKAKLAPLRAALTPEGIAKDGAAFVAWLDQQQEVDRTKRIGTSGYCMGGPFAFRTAAAAPARVGVIASFHGGGLVTDEPDSPHALFPTMKVAALICIAQNDDERQPEAKTALRQAAEAAQTPAEVEVYPAQHGFCVIDSPVYDEAQAERAWARMLTTFQRHLHLRGARRG